MKTEKLTEAKKRTIVSLYHNPEWSLKKIAKKLKLSNVTVGRVVAKALPIEKRKRLEMQKRLKRDNNKIGYNGKREYMVNI